MPGTCPTTAQSFGYSATANASSSPGEIGGVEWSSYTRAYYGKALSQAKTLSDPLSASGTLWIKEGAFAWRDGYYDHGKGLQSGGPLFGFFNSNSREWRTRNSLGFRLEESDGPGLFVVGAEYGTQNYKARGQWLLSPGGSTHLVTGTKYTWSLSYDPAGSNGNGQITFSINGIGTTKLALDAGHKSAGAVFNRFGMVNRMIEGNEATVYFGDLTINGVAENLSATPIDWEGDGAGASFPDCVIDDRHDFGYTGTGNGGGPGQVPAPPNAAGGLFWRTEASAGSGLLAYYADKIPPLTLEQEIYAEGTVQLERASSDSAINFGFFKAGTGDVGQRVPHNFVGIDTDGPSAVGWYFRPSLRSSTGTVQQASGSPTFIPDGSVHQWTLHYVPSTSGGGTLTATLDSQSVSRSISSTVRAEGATLDRFGMRNVTVGGHGQIIYLDNLKYTAPPVTEAPAAPTGLTATAGDQGVSLDWADNTEPDLAGYNVYRSLTPGGPYTKVNGSLVTTSDYSDTGLINGTTYYYVVKAVDTSDNESAASAEASATPSATGDTTPPAPPSGLNATAGDESVSLDWADNAEPDLAGYDVYRSTTPGGPYTKVNGSLVTTSDYSDTGLSNGTTYYYVVKAVDTSGNESAASAEVSATPKAPADTTPPAAPTGLTAAAGNRKVSLNWDDNTESDLAGYRVYRQKANGAWPSSPLAKPSNSAFDVTGLKNDKTYTFRVTAYDQAGNESDPSGAVSATPHR